MPTSQACQHQHQANFSSLKTRTKKPHCNIAAAMLQSGALERNAVLIKNPQTVLWGSGGAGAQRTISVYMCTHMYIYAHVYTHEATFLLTISSCGQLRTTPDNSRLADNSGQAGQAPGRSQHKADHSTDCLMAVQGR